MCKMSYSFPEELIYIPDSTSVRMTREDLRVRLVHLSCFGMPSCLEYRFLMSSIINNTESSNASLKRYFDTWILIVKKTDHLYCSYQGVNHRAIWEYNYLSVVFRCGLWTPLSMAYCSQSLAALVSCDNLERGAQNMKSSFITEDVFP